MDDFFYVDFYKNKYRVLDQCARNAFIVSATTLPANSSCQFFTSLFYLIEPLENALFIGGNRRVNNQIFRAFQIGTNIIQASGQSISSIEWL